MIRFFKGNILGGFRLTDLNRKIQQGEYFYVDAHICDTSRSIKAGLSRKWMTEVTEEEASKHISTPRTVAKKEEQITTDVKVGRKMSTNKVATPNAKETNQKIESRQAAKTFRKQPMQKQKEEDKPIVPNFHEAEKKMRERQTDVTTKGPDEVLRSPVKVAEKKADVTITPEASKVVKDLAQEIQADDALLSTPNFDEKKEEPPKPEKKIIRRRKKIKTETSN